MVVFKITINGVTKKEALRMSGALLDFVFFRRAQGGAFRVS